MACHAKMLSLLYRAVQEAEAFQVMHDVTFPKMP